VSFADEALHDGGAEAGAALLRFGGEVVAERARAENLVQHLRGHAVAGIGDGDRCEGRAIAEAIAVHKPLVGAVRQLIQRDRLLESVGGEGDLMWGGGGLESVDGEVKEELDQIGSVDLGEDIGVQRLNDEVVLFEAGMDAEQFADVAKGLLEADAHACLGGVAEEAEVALGDFNAIIDLPRDTSQAVFDEVEAFAFHAGGTLDAAVDDVDKAGDDGQRAVDIVEHACVDLAFGTDDFLLDLLIAEFFLEVAEAAEAGFALLGEATAVHGAGDGGAHGFEVEGFGEVVAGAVFKGLAGGFDGFVSGQHDDLDGGVALLQLFEEFDAGHAAHADIEDGDIDGVAVDQGEGLIAAVGQKHLIVFLEDHMEGLAWAQFVVDDEQNAAGWGGVWAGGVAGFG
jgi:hypothetical protein